MHQRVKTADHRQTPTPMTHWAAAMAMAAALAAPASAATLNVLVNPGDHGEQTRQASYLVLRAALADALREAKLADANLAISIDATADLAATRAQMHDMYVAPAHVVSSALRNGYVPLVGNPSGAQAVLVTFKASGIKNLAGAKGRRLGLPLQDSVVTYLVRGEVNAANTSIKSHFASVMNTRYQDALLVCLQLRQCDVVGVERGVYERWVAAGEPVALVMESRPAPGISIAMKQSLASSNAGSLRPVLLKALTGSAVAKSGMDQLAPIETKAYEYVSTLGYFTPRLLPGATVVDASAVDTLMKAGAMYFDVRTEAEFKNGHVPGAKLVPYVEKSLKETDYDSKADGFDLAKLPEDKSKPLIFACNGAECWKSYKASKAALAAGFGKVYWFRGGVPEWEKAGLPLVKGGA